MSKPTNIPVLLRHTLALIAKRVFVVFLVLVTFTSVYSITRAGTQHVQAASPATLNFQARLLTSSGNIVPDGIYNVEFKIFNASTSSGSSQGSCTGDANCLWTETRLSSDPSNQQIEVKNGYLSAYLGDKTSLPTNIWNQQLWLTMNIGGTGAASWDGEMTPRIRLTSVPFAFRATVADSAETLQKNTGSFTGTVDFSTMTADRKFLFPDTSLATTASPGTICVFNGSVSNCPAATGSAYYIHNDTALQTQSNFNIQAKDSGVNGTAAGIFRGADAGQTVDLVEYQATNGTVLGAVTAAGNLKVAGSVDTYTGTTLSIGTTNATAITIGKAAMTTTVGGALTVTEAGTFSSTLDINGLTTAKAGLIVTNGGNVSFQKGSDYSTVGSQNDVDFGTGALFRLTGLSAQTITGIANGTDGRRITLVNAGSAVATIANLSGASASNNQITTGTGGSLSVPIGATIDLVYDSSSTVWRVTGGSAATGGAGVNTVGTFSNTSIANGASISGTTITFGAADVTNPGMVSTGTQTFAGNKTFQGALTVGNATATDDQIITAITTGGVARFTGTVTNADLTSNQVYTLPDATGTVITTGNLTDITTVGTITAGTWNGTALTDTYVSNSITIDSTGSVDWTALTSYPGACTAGQAVTQLGDTVTCSAFATGSAADYIQNQNAGAQATSNYWISGSGRADVSFLTPLLDTATAAALGVGTGNANAVNISKAGVVTTINGSLTVTEAATFNSDVTIAAGKYLKLTGGNTASRPASPTDGMLYYDSQTRQLLIYIGTFPTGKWQADRSTATKIVAASNAPQAVKDAADYVANGATDQTVINTALTAAAGGNVYLTEGAYTTTGAILIPNNTTLRGSGSNTKVALNAGAGNVNLIENNDDPGDGIVIQDLYLDGSLGTGGTQNAVSLVNATGLGSISTIDRVTFIGWANGSAVSLDNSVLASFKDNLVSGGALTLTASSSIANITNNFIVGDISLDQSVFYAFSGNTVSGNISVSNSSGVNAILANTIAGTITLNGVTNTAITGNKITNNGVDGLKLINSTGSTITGNTFIDDGSTGNAINISDATSDGTYIADNTLGGMSINDVSGGSVYGGQTDNSGNFRIQPAGEIDLVANTNITGNLVASGDGTFNGGDLTVATSTATNDKLAISISTGGAASFTGTLTNSDLTAARTWTFQDATGVVALGTAGNSLFFTTTGATNVTLPTSGTLCSTTSCGTAGGGYVQFAPGTVQADGTNNNSIFINKTSGTGNILELQKSGVDVFTIDNTGNVAATGTITVTNATTDITTGSNQNLTVVANGTGVIQLNDDTTIGASAGSGTTFTNNGSSVNSTLALTNDVDGGILGATAAATVDIYTSISIAQTTASQSFTIPTPTANTVYGRVIYLSNIGTVSFTLLGSTLNPGVTATLMWANTNGGAAWVYAGADASSINNQKAAGQNGDFWIQAGGSSTGVGRADGGLQAPSLERASAGTLSLGTTSNTTAITMGSTSLTSNLNLDSGASSTINIGSSASARTINIGNVAAVQGITIGSTTSTSTLNLQSGTGNAAGDINIGDVAVTGKIIDIGSVTNSATSTVRIATASGTAQTVSVGSSNTSSITTLTGGTYNLVIRNDGVGIGFAAATAVNYDLGFAESASARTLGVQTRTTNAGGTGLTISAGAAGAGGSAFGGGVLTLQGGAAGGTGNANGGSVTIAGGAGVGTGTQGLVNLATSAFTSATEQAFATSVSVTAGNVDLYSTLPVKATATSLTLTVPDPAQSVIGRLLYISARSGSSDFTMRLNSARTPIDIAMKANSTATLIWNGTDWTAAGASSSTDLQSAYNNTLTSAGGAEIILNASGGAADGFTIRNNGTTPISGGILEVQSSIGTNLFSVNNLGTELAANGGSETLSTFATNWTAATAGGTVSRNTTAGQYVTGLAGAQVVTTTTANTGIRNNLSGNPVNTIGAKYQVSFVAKSSLNGTAIDVQYSRDGGTTLTACTDYGAAGSQNLSDTIWTKITCTITIASATAATDPDLLIRKTDGSTAPTIYIDNLSFVRNDTTTTPSNVQIGGGINGGPVTLFTLDRASAPPVANGNTTYYGSMYYDTTTGRIQCYESDGWGACGSAPDNIITLTPEYTGAVLNGTGVGVMTADFCANESTVLVVGSLCAVHEARSFYRWTSPQATNQTYDIYVNYKLPSTFKGFYDANTIKLTAYKDHATNAGATLNVYRKNVVGNVITQCGSSTAITTGTGAWNQTALTGDETACGFVAGDYVVFKITVTSNSSANVYIENLDFTFSNT